MASELPDEGTRVQADSLERDLRGRVDGEVRFDAGTRGTYSTDASNFRQVPAATRPYLHNSEDGDNHFDSCGVYKHYISDSVQYTEQ